MFAQMEGKKNYEIDENGVPEVHKCCRVCIFRFAAFEKASERFSVQNEVLQPEMLPKWTRNGNGNSTFEGWIFDANFEMHFLNSSLPKPPPGSRVGGRGHAATPEVK